MPDFYGDDNEPDISVFAAAAGALEELQNQNPELAKKLVEELQMAASGVDQHILLVGTDGDFTVTIFHVDPAAVSNSEKPVLFPSADKNSILAAISREVIERKVEECEELDRDGDRDGAEQMWGDYMDELMKAVTAEHKKHPRTI